MLNGEINNGPKQAEQKGLDKKLLLINTLNKIVEEAGEIKADIEFIIENLKRAMEGSEHDFNFGGCWYILSQIQEQCGTLVHRFSFRPTTVWPEFPNQQDRNYASGIIELWAEKNVDRNTLYSEDCGNDFEYLAECANKILGKIPLNLQNNLTH